jgi:hypothetical protein
VKGEHTGHLGDLYIVSYCVKMVPLYQSNLMIIAYNHKVGSGTRKLKDQMVVTFKTDILGDETNRWVSPGLCTRSHSSQRMFMSSHVSFPPSGLHHIAAMVIVSVESRLALWGMTRSATPRRSSPRTTQPFPRHCRHQPLAGTGVP